VKFNEKSLSDVIVRSLRSLYPWSYHTEIVLAEVTECNSEQHQETCCGGIEACNLIDIKVRPEKSSFVTT